MQTQFHVFKGTLDELYEVVKTAAVETNFESYRIEVLKDCYSDAPTYKVRYWRQRLVSLKPASEVPGQPPGQELERQGVWVEDHLPWVQADDADGALHQALGFLSQRFQK
jgi:hypothetical protein